MRLERQKSRSKKGGDVSGPSTPVPPPPSLPRQSSTSREHLRNVRVVQRNLVYVVGLAPSLAKEEVRSPPARTADTQRHSLSRSASLPVCFDLGTPAVQCGSG
jgi:hypothetical protein